MIYITGIFHFLLINEASALVLCSLPLAFPLNSKYATFAIAMAKVADAYGLC